MAKAAVPAQEDEEEEEEAARLDRFSATDATIGL